ncbi:hypothetical protein [Arthrobacter sp. UYCo732]|uniref:hypothetical protein n=1 Tax=Arthrobacter sp. UYCo732 TaxID=3156336 RepID=UPI003395F886
MPADSENYYAQQSKFTGNTVIEISVPSGRLIATDDLRSTNHFDIEPPFSINYGSGLDAWAKAFAARTNAAYAFVGNTCPSVTRRNDGSIQVVTPAWSEDEGGAFNDDEVVVAKICTDLWATMLTDYQNWLDHGGPEVAVANADFAFDTYTVFEVTPGKYRWTVYSHNDHFDRDAEGRITYARLELLDTY